jgi:asparagine synthase (glutamine-hydrolysing)
MCGLAGIFATDGQPVDRAALLRMTRAIAHRGPDGEGTFVDGPLGLGHRRLAIIDLSPAGRQPMSTPDGSYVVVYNGEIYNHPEIRKDLVRRGHKFVSRTDTEVVLHAWAEWGPDAVLRFNGMFAFAIWEAREKRLTLVRDKHGIKPLYYAKVSDVFLFGSEQRALLQHPAVGKTLDKCALVEYLTFQNILSDRTFNRDIRILPAGHTLKIGIDGSLPKLTQYWDFRFEESSKSKSQEDLEEELESLIRKAVQRQLQSDVEIGAYLSGGLDSGTLATLAAAQNPKLKTFTCGFDTTGVSEAEAHFDERMVARELAAQLGTSHSEVIVGESELGASVDLVTAQLEEPRVGQSYPNYLVAALAAKSVKVVLSGAGGDELFAGYPWRYSAALSNSNEQRFRDEYFRYWNRLIPREALPQVLAPVWSEVKDYDPREVFDFVIGQHRVDGTGNTKFLSDCLYFEAKTFLHGLLVVEDKLSMVHGLETRLPFLDDDVVKFAMSCPAATKVDMVGELNRSVAVDQGASASREGKIVLRKVLGRIAGKSVASRPKQGFSAPDTLWLAKLVVRLLNQKTTSLGSIRAIVDTSFLHSLVGGIESPGLDARRLSWSIVSVNAAIRQLSD